MWRRERSFFEFKISDLKVRFKEFRISNLRFKI